MQWYSAHVEVASRKDADTDAAMEALAPFHPSVGMTPAGSGSAQISLTAENLTAATVAALAVVSAAFGGAEPVACEVMTEAEFDRRQGWEPMPELLSVSQAAEALGVTRQAVLQRIGSGSLPARKVGSTWAVPAGAVGR